MSEAPETRPQKRSCPHCLAPYSGATEFCGLDGTRVEAFDVDPLIGADVDRYRVIGRLGNGAMASVYHASHRTLPKRYALKVLFGEGASNKILAERFRREALAVSKMRHRNIVSVEDFGVTSKGLTFMVMELVEGRTLRWLIRRGGPLEPWRVLLFVRQIAEGLAEAHARGFLHRDLKPSNVMVTEQDGVDLLKILDFGLVRAQGQDDDEPWLTKTGQFVGTPTYMAPEQVSGSDVTALADLYALGIMTYEMLEGRPPFAAKRVVEMQRKHLFEVPARPRAASGLETLAMDLLEKQPSHRPQSANEVIARLDALSIPAPSTQRRTLLSVLGATAGQDEDDAARDRFDLGMAMKELERFDDAMREFTAAASSKAMLVASLEQIGHCLVRKGDARTALQYFLGALQQSGATGAGATNLKFEIAATYEAAGDVERARQWFDDVRAEAPRHRDVDKRLAALGGSATVAQRKAEPIEAPTVDFDRQEPASEAPTEDISASMIVDGIEVAARTLKPLFPEPQILDGRAKRRPSSGKEPRRPR